MWYLLVLLFEVNGVELPRNCVDDQYYDPGSMTCQLCPVNASMVRSPNGFSCKCDDHSVASGGGQCKPCSVTELVSADGSVCVPRKCHNVSGKVACRKCPNDYISVTQNLDGSAMREVQCVKCAKGFKPQDNVCVRCESCSCARNQVTVRGSCLPKAYVNERPTYQEKLMHPLELLDVVKYEYLCTKNYSLMCRKLADKCVKNFYSSDLGGACRLWFQPKMAPKVLPALVQIDKSLQEMTLPRGKGKLSLAVAIYTSNGGLIFIDDTNNAKGSCRLPVELKLGNDVTSDCKINMSEHSTSELNGTLSPFVLDDEEYKPLSVIIRKPSGYYVQRGSWPNISFNRYFIVHQALSTTSNTTNTVYLRNFLIRLRINRDSHANGSLHLQISIEAQYATTDHLDSVITTLKVENIMPNAGVVRGIEVWSGILGAVLSVYALVQWRGLLRRGGLHYSLLPLMSGAVADILYFAALFATLHALAAEAGTLGMTLPLSKSEEKIVKDFLLSAICMKVLKMLWINWKQCTCDIYFLSWAEYNPPIARDASTANINDEHWKSTTLAREWSLLQTVRRASPGFTVTGALMLLQVIFPWQSYLPSSPAYKWAVASIAWWSSYGVVALTSWCVDKFLTSPTCDLPKLCTRAGISLLVFQEENYAHYVHGRNDDSKEVRSMAGPLAKCRVACVPQLRAVCKQLTAGPLGETESRQALLSKFLAAFFERALDGLNWVACERTVLERLLDVEMTSREAGGTSALLYDDDNTPSCFNMTWWGEEWTLATFDAMLFSCILICSGDTLLSVLVVITVWQALKHSRTWLGNRNQVLKTGVDAQIY